MWLHVMEDKTKDFGSNYDRDSLMRMPVYDLRIGMFVAQLDRPWLETPFAVQGFFLNHDSQIDEIAQHCEHVYVMREDVVQKRRQQKKHIAAVKFETLPDGGTSLSIAHSERTSKDKSNAIVRPGAAYKMRKSAVQEHQEARAAYDRGKVAFIEIQNSVRDGQSLDVELVEQVVADCVASIVRNPDAMVWMSRVRGKAAANVEHSLNACVLAIVFGRYLNFDERELHVLGVCGLLHDIGNMKIPSDILDNPGPLADDQIKIMRSHTVRGYKVLTETKGILPAVIDAALNHHERPDGSGYPQGILGDNISESAKIIGIVDAYDAMNSERSYARALLPNEAQKVLYEYRDKQFDEAYVMQFMRAVGPYPPGTWVELHNGMVGIVLSANNKYRNLPVVSLVLDGDKNPVEEKFLDLLLTDTRELDKGFLIKNALADGSNNLWLKDIRLQLERQTTAQ